MFAIISDIYYGDVIPNRRTKIWRFASPNDNNFDTVFPILMHLFTFPFKFYLHVSAEKSNTASRISWSFTIIKRLKSLV